MSDPVLVERKGAVAIVTLNRPEVLNALNPAMAATLGESARVVVSEPIGRFAEIWNEIPQGSSVHVRAGEVEVRPFAPRE